MTTQNGDAGNDSNATREYQSRLDTVFYLLAHRRRRTAIGYLRSQDRPVDDEELVEAILRSEFAGSEPSIPQSRRQTVEIDVSHSHLPKLAAAGVVEQRDGGYAYVGDPLVEEVLDALGSANVPAIPESA